MDFLFTHNMKVLWKVILFCFTVLFWVIICLDKPQNLKTPSIFKANKTKTYQKVLIMAYWRTGSTYFGQLLSRYPRTYYNYEPLHLFSNKKNHWKNYTLEDGIDLIEDIFACNFYSNTTMKYLEHSRKHRFRVALSVPYLSDNCKSKSKCFDPDLHFKLCANSSMNMIKTVRLRISAVKILLQNDPNIKVIVLVRDPRAVLNSRWTGYAGWCGDKPHCKEVSSFCTELTRLAINILVHYFSHQVARIFICFDSVDHSLVENGT